MGLVVEYAVLFGWSFLAATVLPLGSEVAFAAVVHRQDQLLMPIAVAKVGNSLGAFTTYWLGARAADLASEHGGSSARVRRAAELLKRHGQPVVFLSWVPVLGDALVAAAGAARMARGPFVAWVVSGKALRVPGARLVRAEDRLTSAALIGTRQRIHAWSPPFPEIGIDEHWGPCLCCRK